MNAGGAREEREREIRNVRRTETDREKWLAGRQTDTDTADGRSPAAVSHHSASFVDASRSFCVIGYPQQSTI